MNPGERMRDSTSSHRGGLAAACLRVRRRAAALGASLLAALASFAAPALAQEQTPERVVHDESNVWMVYTGKYPFSGRLGIYAEAQLRRSDFLASPKQVLLRPGLVYQLTRGIEAALGYAYQRTSPNGGFPTPIPVSEHRIWEQILLQDRSAGVQLEHRYRLEHRWQSRIDSSTEPPHAQGWVQTNRARYQLRLTGPISADSLGNSTAYWAFSEEPFISFGKQVKSNVFDQNRAFVGFGYRWSDALRVEAGYLMQVIVQSNGRDLERNHVLQIAVTTGARAKGREQP
jgi:Protein of unknown function (DUF2490)